MSRKDPVWRCKNWMNGVTCERPFADNTATRKRYDVKHFPTRAAYEASDMYPSRRKTIKSRKSSRTKKRVVPSSHVHRMRLIPTADVPTTARGILSAVPKNWRDQSDPFEKPRRWRKGSLPSFKKMGAIGKGNFDGVVIYSDKTYRKYQNR